MSRHERNGFPPIEVWIASAGTLSGRRKTRSGFTLIEILVVITIMSMLAGLAFTGLNKGLNIAKENTAAAEARAIAGAVQLFYKDYGWMPVPAGDQGFEPGPGAGDYGDEQDKQSMSEDESKRIVKVLLAVDEAESTRINPRRKVYLDIDAASSDGTLLDPWGNQYRIKLDLDYNGKLEYYSDPMQFNTRAIVVSGGKPGWNGGVPADSKKIVANVIFDSKNL